MLFIPLHIRVSLLPFSKETDFQALEVHVASRSLPVWVDHRLSGLQIRTVFQAHKQSELGGLIY